METIKVQLNGEPREIVADRNLTSLLEHFGFPNKLIAVELNNNVIRRAQWPQTIVHDGDRVEVVHFVGGG